MAAAPRSKGGLSLYDNLADPNDSSATISSAPVSYAQTDPAASESSPAAKKPLDPALRFQPIRRPQAKQASKPKGFFPKGAATISKPPIPAAAVAAPPTDTSTAPPSSAPAPAPAKSTLADWAATEDDGWRYGGGGGGGEKRQRGGRKRKKRKQEMQAETDWDEIYDPTRPTNVDEYLRSDEKISEVREWRALLYRHRRRSDRDSMSSDEEDERPSFSNQFAPPPSFNAFPPPPSSPPAAQPDDKPDDDVNTPRAENTISEALEPAAPQTQTDSVTISKAPVRYTQPPEATRDKEEEDDDEEMDDRPMLGSGGPDDDDDTPRSNRPGQADFATRLMSKYGWTKGTGLGADESGIVNPLRVQVEKRRKKADADGGGWAEPGGKGKIIGGGKRKGEASKFGPMSEVVILQNMLENMPDLQKEIADGLGQEIGEECGDKYGRVERLYIDQQNRQVFIKFTDQVSALRAVSELDGRVFNGNVIVPKFYDVEKFEKGIYVA